MAFDDVKILSKKILIGIVIYLVPLIIIGGGLWLLTHLPNK